MPSRTLALLTIAVLFAAALFAQTSPSLPQQTPSPGAQPSNSATPPRDNASGQTAGTGIIRGRVTAADTGNPLRRAQVRIASVQPSVIQTMTTGADGRFEFVRLPGAPYSITVTRNGYLPLQFGQQRPFEPGKPLRLADGQLAEKIDFALPRGGVIAGRITDEFGEPIAGVRMQAQRYQYQPGGQRRLVTGASGPGVFSLTSDDLGQFRVYGLMAGSYVLSATPTLSGITAIQTPSGIALTVSDDANATEPDGYATTYYPGTANVDEAQTIAVEASQEASAYFSLVSARMAKISGVVRNSMGAPAERMMVSLRTFNGNGFFSTGAGITTSAGSFNMANVPPGDYMIEVRPASGPLPPVLGADGARAQVAETEVASVPITIAGQDVTGLLITTGPGATVSGRVIFDGTSPRPQNAQPLRVNAIPPDPAMMMGFTLDEPHVMDNGVVDESGRFQLRGVNGRVLFQMGAPGWNLQSVTLNGVDITDIPYEAKPGTSVTGLEIILTDRRTNLSGTVKDSRGEVVKNYVVAIFPDRLKDGALSTRFTRTVRPDQFGNFQLSGMPPGDYVAVAVSSLDQGDEWDPAFQEHMKPLGKPFRLDDGQGLSFDLQLIQ